MFVEDEWGQCGECDCGGCSFWPDCSGCAVNPIYNEPLIDSPLPDSNKVCSIDTKNTE